MELEVIKHIKLLLSTTSKMSERGRKERERNISEGVNNRKEREARKQNISEVERQMNEDWCRDYTTNLHTALF